MEDVETRTTLEVIRRTFPAPDGERDEGQAAVRAFWERFLASTPRALFETEEAFDVMKVRDGKVAEKLAYVKG